MPLDSDQPVSKPSLDELLAHVRTMLPRLRERARQADVSRTLSPETLSELTQSGLYRIFQPARYGGYELDFVALLSLSSELARACGSTAWVYANLAEHNRLNGMRDPRAQEDLWGFNQNATVSASFPTGAAHWERVEGGVVLDGTWGFSSGIDAADWNDFTIFLPREGNAPPEHHFAMAPRAQIEIIDDWHATGLRGTGSKSTRASKLFVPAHRLVSTERCRGGPTEGSAVNPGPLYRTPVYALGGKIFSICVLGIARGALDLIKEDLATRIGVSQRKISDQATAQSRIAEADAEIEAAAALLERDCFEAMRFARAAEEPPLERRVIWRRNDAYATKLCVSAVERLHALAGARRLADTDPFQRAWRDIHAAASQIQLNWDAQSINFGRVAFGMAPLDPRI